MIRQLPSGFDRTHLAIFLGIYAVAALLTFLAVGGGVKPGGGEAPPLVTTLSACTGPFEGAICRNGQSCCLAASLSILPVSASLLAAGTLAQIVPLPMIRLARPIRLAA